MNLGQLYHSIRRSVVKIYIDGTFLQGFIENCKAHYACIVASITEIPIPSERSSILVVFPDGKMICPVKPKITTSDDIALIKFDIDGDGIDINLMKPLKLCTESLSISEKIYTYSSCTGDDEKGVITPGSVISIHDGYFHHNCSANKTSHHGALVINNNAELIGLCYDFDCYLTSKSAESIEDELFSLVYQGL